jgi:hypothetical protein
MPFLLYKKESDHCFVRIREVVLPRSIKSYVMSKGSDDADELQWHIESKALLKCEVPHNESPNDYSLMIDLKPRDKTAVSIYQLLEIWGVSYGTWTPVLMHLQPLWSDWESPDPEAFKKRFALPSLLEAPIYEFLYLNHKGGRARGWTWGLVGRVNGALLWPGALTYFMKQIDAQMLRP